MAQYSDKTFEAILEEEKGLVDSDVQKGDGSLVHSALAPTAYEVEKLYIQLDYLDEQSHANTADYDHLKKMGKDEAERVAAACEATGSIEGLAACPFLLMGEKDVPGEFSRRKLAEAGISPEVRVVSKNSETLMALALRGVGACFVPSELVATSFADPEAAGMRVIHLGEEMSYPLSVAWRSADHVWSAVIGFDQVLRQQFADGSRMT